MVPAANERFVSGTVEAIIKSSMEARLANQTFEEAACKIIVLELITEIKEKVRRKIIAHTATDAPSADHRLTTT